MSGPRIGSVCSGYGGLDSAAQAVLGGEVVWVSDIDKGACKILAHRYPNVPNLGDFTTTDWTTVEPVDVFTAGFPCQPVSHAGKRLGDDDERWLWDDVARAVGALRPGLVILENVRGLLSAGGGRLFGQVLGTLAELGYDAQWHGLRAADVGAPHGRWRVFIVAWPVEDPQRLRREARWLATAGEAPSGWAPAVASGPGGVDEPRAGLSLLPTPACNDMGEGKTPEAWDEWTAKMQAAHGNGNGHGKSLAIEAQRLLPTPRAGDGEKGGPNQAGSSGDLMLSSAVQPHRWGIYADAIARWETLTRPAPAPTQPSKKGTPQLSARFSEWLMGLPDGWVTDVPGITRNEALKAIGNGVCPQQAEAALRLMLTRQEAAA